MTLEALKQKKKELAYTNEMIAKLSGVPLGTVQKIFAGVTKSPRRETLCRIESVLDPEIPMVDTAEKEFFRESSAIYQCAPGNPDSSGRAEHSKKTGKTLSDYLALPEDQRVELIDGVFYDMAAPTTVHQAFGGEIFRYLLNFVRENGGQCMPFVSPVDVQLDCDEKTVVQPDVLIVCDRSKFRNGRVLGAPDFLVEVLSPSTRRKDVQLKTYKYANAGVREYWIVDPEKKRVVVYDFEHEDIPSVFTFADKVPVGIWDGACRVDFAEIYSFVSFLYDEAL